VSIPCLIVNSADDPVSVVQNVHDHEEVPVRCLPHSTPLQKFLHNDFAVLALTRWGSHCCFFDFFGYGSWLDDAIGQFVEASLERYRSTRGS